MVGDIFFDRYIVLGASGFIGAELLRAVSGHSEKLLGTACTRASGAIVKFDLMSDSLDVLPPEFRSCNGEKSMVVIASGINRIDQCRLSPDAYKINVERTLLLARSLSDIGYKVTFISSDNVFDGRRGNYSEEDSPNPLNEYGKQKLMAEKMILEYCPLALVVRLSKIVSRRNDEKNLFNEWLLSAKMGKTIKNIAGMTFSPTDVSDIATGLVTAQRLNLSGLYHMANPEPFERNELCRIFLQKLKSVCGISGTCESAAYEKFNLADYRPLKTNLNSSKFIVATNMSFSSMENIIEMFCRSLR